MKIFSKLIACMLSLIMCISISVFDFSGINLTADAVESPIKPKIKIDSAYLMGDYEYFGNGTAKINVTLSGDM